MGKLGTAKTVIQLIVLVPALSLFPAALAGADDSICYGTTSRGRLENGVRLPARGDNFVSYGTLPELAGRTYVHSTVRDVIVDAYRMLEKDQPEKVFKFAETGFREGGEFKPHKTHRNGLSVDFIVPVMDSSGTSVLLPTNPFNKYGYSVEFDGRGLWEKYRIDFDAMGAHIVALHRASKKQGVGLWQVIFDPMLQKYLFDTRHGEYLKKNVRFSKKPSWVRHDEHYHVDFKVKCRPM